jgi:uncharacterized membrane protein
MTAEPDTLVIAAASYDSREAAVADYEAVKALYEEIGASHAFDAAVIAKDAEGEVEVVKKHEEPTRHEARHGLRWGLAAGALTAIFPAVGLAGALAVGGGAGAAAGAVAGHIKGGLADHDLEQLGKTLENGQAGLLVIYAFDMADQVAANIKAANRIVSHQVDLAADQMAADIRAAQAEG